MANGEEVLIVRYRTTIASAYLVEVVVSSRPVINRDEQGVGDVVKMVGFDRVPLS